MKNSSLRILLVVSLLAAVIMASGIGAMSISPAQVIAILAAKAGIRLPVSYTPGMENVLWQIRLPRVCMAVLIGSGLAVSGAALQGLFRNPMADPILIGISSGASLFAVGVIVLTAKISFLYANHFLQYYLINAATFSGACLTSLLVMRLARTGGKTSVAALLLGGLAINAICNALTGLATYTANNDQLRDITFWILGSLGAASWPTVTALFPFVLFPVILLPMLAKSLNAYTLGEAEALFMGVHVKRLKWQVVLLSTLAVGACVAVSGIIGFVGLIVPHILRSAGGSDHRTLLPNSALLGAILLTLADTLSRTIISPAELPIGILTAILGTPLFIGLLLKQKKQLANLAV